MIRYGTTAFPSGQQRQDATSPAKAEEKYGENKKDHRSFVMSSVEQSHFVRKKDSTVPDTPAAIAGTCLALVFPAMPLLLAVGVTVAVVVVELLPVVAVIIAVELGEPSEPDTINVLVADSD
jgi:hypothetical protein